MNDFWEWVVANANTISAVASATAAVASAGALVFAAVQIRQASRSTDFDNLVHLDGTVRELERDYVAMQGASSEDERRHSHVQLYNRLETLATGVKYKLLAKQSRDVATNLLVDIIALDETRGHLEHLGLDRQGSAYEAVAWFSQKYRDRIVARRREYEHQAAS